MRYIKYSNTMVMYVISLGYLILIMTALFLHLNIMYILAPYVLLTLVVITYTQKRSSSFTQYCISFELGINEKGHFFKFYILAANINGNVKILKLRHYQTQYIINPPKLQAMLASLGYSICYSPDWESQIVTPALINSKDSINIQVSHYEQILSEFKTFKSAVINKFKQNQLDLLELNINQPIFNSRPKKRKSITSFLRQQ